MDLVKRIFKWGIGLLFIFLGITDFFSQFIDSMLVLEDLSEPLKLSNVDIGFVVLGFIISPLFDFICKKFNKKFSGLRKIILSYGTFVISIICSLIFSEIWELNTLGFIWSIILTLLFILFFFFIMFVTNKHKYDDKVKNHWLKIVFVIVILFLIPYVLLKGLIVNNYNNLLKELNITFLDAVKIESVELKDEDYYIFENLKLKNVFKEYSVLNQEDEIYKSITLKNSNNEGIKAISISTFDYFREFYNEINNASTFAKMHPYANYILKNEINSEQNFYRYLSNNQEFSIFNKSSEVLTTWILSKVGLSSSNSFQLVENSKYNISVIRNDINERLNVRVIQVIDNDDSYIITLWTDKNYSDDEMYSLIKTIKID